MSSDSLPLPEANGRDQAFNGYSYSSPHQLEPSVTQRTERLITPIKPTTGLVAIEEFLRSLEPSMEGLAVRFAAAGIVDAGCLRGLARLNETERYMFLKEDLRLDAFQLRVIRVALGSMI